MDKQTTNKFLIGKGTAVLCPIVSTFLMGLLKIDEKIMHHIQFTLLGFALVFFYSPNIFFSSLYHLPAPLQKIHKRFLVTHGAMIFFLIRNYKAETAEICFMQAVMWIWSFVAIHEFSSVYGIDLRSREDFLNWDYEEEQDTPAPGADHNFPVVEQEIQNDGRNKEEQDPLHDSFRLMNIPRYLEALLERLWNMKQLKKTSSGYECKICLLDYSTTRIPKILSKCGHTICEKCAGQLLKDGTSIRCPFCRESTVVQGTVQQMPKNYELMEVIEI
ncbi:hypothetical protein GCK72_011330 [Caenorhabditis remanei]|uniref:RING-type domain-containing protein n=1 Tax=Caenorhabditis remanei TaxID=31234 RepID=A0A6A5H7H0_CAERE|nr:hypothetical protein GCK72_011330 [Caenorhabditis remanei]KAF1763065.1 hypothetical protein GCK72_011330 [Caenorhabditis remanei]